MTDASGDLTNAELPPLVHEYAQLFAEFRHRTGFRPFSVRQRFDHMTDAEVNAALDAVKARLARVPPAETVQDDERTIRLTDAEQICAMAYIDTIKRLRAALGAEHD